MLAWKGGVGFSGVRYLGKVAEFGEGLNSIERPWGEIWEDSWCQLMTSTNMCTYIRGEHAYKYMSHRFTVKVTQHSGDVCAVPTHCVLTACVALPALYLMTSCSRSWEPFAHSSTQQTWTISYKIPSLHEQFCSSSNDSFPWERNSSWESLLVYMAEETVSS